MGNSSFFIRSRAFDTFFIIGPAWFASIAAIVVGLFARSRGLEIPSLGPMAWFVLVLLVDVAHVYSTLYRTYLDPRERADYRNALLWIPVLAWTIGTLLHTLDPIFFWRSLAYVAVFHFIRQQYGFLAIYSARDGSGISRLDRAVIYAVTLYPVLYWHTHLPRDFVWFIAGDFFAGIPSIVEGVARLLTLGIFGGWAIELAVRKRRGKPTGYPKIFWVLGTALSWNLGIVVFNSDLLFTMTNVLAHGIPYLALVWFTGRAGADRDPSRELSLGRARIRSARFFTAAMIPVFFGILAALAYLAEGIWDVWIWKDHASYFPLFHRALSGFEPGPELTSVLVALLTLPQATHYLLDGFIWRIRRIGILYPSRS